MDELGGESAWRLLFGAFLTDLAIEHYSWVAIGDQRHPDPTTIWARADAFVDGIEMLFVKK